MNFTIPNLSFFKIEEARYSNPTSIFKRLWKSWGTEKDLADTTQYEQVISSRVKKHLPQINVLDPNGKLFMGSFPGDRSDHFAKNKLKQIHEELRVRTYVNLLTESERKKFKSYSDMALEVGATDFLYFPIPDMGIAEDSALLDFLENILLPAIESKQSKQESFYLHCWGGHGRTGILAGILIGIFYGLSGDEALSHVERVHAMRINFHMLDLDGNRVPYTSPQTDPQRNQVRRILEIIQKKTSKE